MIDVSSLRAPGWQRVVSELTTPAADDRHFLLKLLGVLGQVSSARQAVLFGIAARREESQTGVEVRGIVAWPLGEPGSDAEQVRVALERFAGGGAIEDSEIEECAEVKSAARQAAQQRSVKVFSLSREDALYDEARPTVLALPIQSGDGAEGALHGVVTLLVDARSRQAVQTTLALCEVLSGYAWTHAAQKALARARASAASLDLAARLIAAVNSVEGFKGAALQFVNDLCRALGVDRAALGWAEGARPVRPEEGDRIRRFVKCVALSDTENLDRRMAMVRKIEAAMDECLDQEQTVVYPPPPAEADVLLSQAVVHAHQELGAQDARLRIASFPLRAVDGRGERLLGVVTIESAGEGRLDPQMAELVQAALDLAAPVLAVRHSDDRILALRAWDWCVKTAAWAVGPTHTVWKAAGLAAMALMLVVVFVKTPYRPGASSELLPLERRMISAPFDAVISGIGQGAEAGAAVEAGQALVMLDTTERRLSALEAQSQITQYEIAADEALKRGQVPEERQARARAEQARARFDLLQNQIGRSTIAAPISGTIIAGDLRPRVGSSVRLGDKLFEVADLSTIMVVARVDDRDISFIEPGQTGEFAAKGAPEQRFGFVVERIVPLSAPHEGGNVFEVHGRLSEAAPAWFRPGMEGRAKFDGPRRSLLWIATRRVVDTARVWLWW